MVLPLITVEVVGSRKCNISIDNPSQELLFMAMGSDDEPTIRAQIELDLTAAIQVSSAFFGTRTLVIQSYECTHQGNGVWEGKAMYGRRPPRQTGDIVLSFDGTGGTQHITNNPNGDGYTVGWSVNGDGFTASNGDGLAADFDGAIGVNRDNVAGTDITVPVCKFTFEYYAPMALMTQQYILQLMTQAGTINDNPWMGFDTGEVLYLGTAGQPRSLDDWQLLMHFIASPNLAGKNALSFGPITGVEKGGWDYLWVRFKDAVSGANGVKVPQFVYTESVYLPSDFTQLGIGGDLSQVLNTAAGPNLSINVPNVPGPNLPFPDLNFN
jgi:hypothetical protein